MKPHNSRFERATWKDVVGTSLRGYLTAPYSLLVEAFGPPDLDDDGDGKTDVEWALRFPDGAVVTVYNWKNGPRYGGPAIERIREWNVGGLPGTWDAAERVLAVLEGRA